MFHFTVFGLQYLVVSYPLFLWRTFQWARLFLLPILRRRLGFAIKFSVKQSQILLQNTFDPVKYMLPYKIRKVKK